MVSHPMPPAEVKTNGSKDSMLNVPNSMTIFLLLCIFMVFINRSKTKKVVTGSIGVKYLTSKYASWPLFQKPLVVTSKWASLVVLADAREKVSEVIGSKDDSVTTLWHISVSQEALRSQCLIVENLPKGHSIAWSTEKEVPHWQVLDILDGVMP